MAVRRLLGLGGLVTVMACGASGDAGLSLPSGFLASAFTTAAPGARHIAVTSGGDLIVGLEGVNGGPGGVRVFRDLDGDGVADTMTAFGSGTTADVDLFEGWLYVASRTSVVRYPWSSEKMLPEGPADTVVKDLPGVSQHSLKTVAIDSAGVLFVNIGSPTNACTPDTSDERGASQDPCPELRTRAGIWRFDARRTGQRQGDGQRWATGIRNAVALAIRPADAQLYAVIHGRDRLSQKYPELFDERANAELPAEEFVRLPEGADIGYPYCYFDHLIGRRVLAPEYGGDGSVSGRCAGLPEPVVAFPGHWAPNDLLFHDGRGLPARFAGGAFIAFHGSWNRRPLPQEGFRVSFLPLDSGSYSGFETFAGRFDGPWWRRAPAHRPVGLAMAPDGAIFVSDDVGGWIYRIVYRGEQAASTSMPDPN